jgi:hypothetical protein
LMCASNNYETLGIKRGSGDEVSSDGFSCAAEDRRFSS